MKTARKDAAKPVDAHVGHRVRMRRMMLGMGQMQLAEAVGLTYQQIQKYEKGINRVSASRLHEFAQILQVVVSWFFEGAPGQPDPVADDVARFLATHDGIRLSRAFVEIEDSELRRCIVGLVEQIAENTRAQ